MSCSHPLFMVKRGIKENGKQDLIFASEVAANLGLSQDELKARYGDRLVPVPCGKCVGCKLDKSKEWAVRCCLEALDHRENCFLTLTFQYEPKRLDKKHLKRFFWRFYKAHPDVKIRYFACGEKGETTGRRHYHVLIFGYGFPDKTFYKKVDGSDYFISEELKILWPYGISVVGDVSKRSAAYVARYTMKKASSNDKEEFIVMSRRPGIAYNWFLEHKDIIYLSDHIYGNFGDSHVASVPRYFDKLAEQYGIDISETKDNRVRLAMNYDLLARKLYHAEAGEALNCLFEDLLLKRIKYLRRNL